MMDLKEIRIWNIKYNLLTPSEIANIVSLWLEEGKRGIHLTGVNYPVVVMAQDNYSLRKAILESDIVNVDSTLPAFFIKKKGFNIKGRAATPDVMEELMRKANEKGQTVFFLGARQETLDKLKVVLEKEYPNLRIVGMQNGYYDLDKESIILERIKALAPDYLFLAFPSPQKELFILENKHMINAGVFYGIGGALDAKAGVLKRPPKWLREHGLEGLFRLIRKPLVYAKRFPLMIQFFKLVKTEL